MTTLQRCKGKAAKVVRQLDALQRFKIKPGSPHDPSYVDYVNRKLHEEESLRKKLGFNA